jgi:hypothetical protein
MLHSQYYNFHKRLCDTISTITSPNPSLPQSLEQSQQGCCSSSSGSHYSSLFTNRASFSNIQRDQRRDDNQQPGTQTATIRKRKSFLASIDKSILNILEEDEKKLKNVIEQIKDTLTELEDCEEVRCDEKSIMWVHTRLADAEQALRALEADFRS